MGELLVIGLDVKLNKDSYFKKIMKFLFSRTPSRQSELNFEISKSKWHLLNQSLGLYLLYYLIVMIPFLQEIYIKDFSSLSSNFIHILTTGWTAQEIYYIVYSLNFLGIFCSLLLLRGCPPRWIYIVLFLTQTCFVHINTLTSDPSLHYIGMLLFFLGISESRVDKNSLDQYLIMGWSWYRALSWIFAFTMGVSALTKLQSPSWMDGTAIEYILKSPLGKTNFLTSILLENLIFLKILTFMTIVIQAASFPLVVLRYERIIFLLSLLEFISILFMIHLNQVAIGMIVFLLALELIRPTKRQIAVN